MDDPKFEVVQTRTGAFAMRDRRNGETMHPGTGASVEPVKLYVEPSRLSTRLSDVETPSDAATPLVLLDVGLGAASNAIAAWKVSEAKPSSARRLEIVSFENDLGALELALTQGERFDLTGAALAAAQAILSGGRHETDRTVWRLVEGNFVDTIAKEKGGSADIVFWDFYSPKTDPSLWNVATLRALRRVCRDNATFHTYSTATSLRSGLLLSGFAVGTGRGTGDRSESTVAATNVMDLEYPLDERWLERLSRSHVPFPLDVPEDPEARAQALEAVRGCPQFQRLGSR